LPDKKMAGLILLFLPILLFYMMISVLVLLCIAGALLAFHCYVTCWAYGRWPITTLLFTLLWLGISYQTQEPFLYAQLFRFSLPVDFLDGSPDDEPHSSWFNDSIGSFTYQHGLSNWRFAYGWANDLRGYPHKTWLVQCWYRSAWFGHWGDTRERSRYDTLDAAMEHVKSAAGQVDWDIWKIQYHAK
jgi:hypothetical protein